ncbi:DUF1365 domain-containing protein [Granulosicoccus antarcticus]|uniref:DUF1365 domain-containing protein n=1 Tax=Granulosicoccus antarcticus IMCC3135 TaxID=1192854 RepID=A0A2Z2NVK4_9GAMM|nr:DUF1365 family protein [Granulosicoccus antarcticus]ASJ71707.1 hypothetical protein IMCC3135_08020 [Granulosicoccus antarcticus IMCC3135]
MSFNSRLYAGQVYHRRTRPREHKIRYSVFTLFLDLDEIDQLDANLWLFSRNRYNLFSFYDRDFGEDRAEKLTDYVHRKLKDAGFSSMPEQILLSCYPRVMGYVFNPLSLFYCLDGQGKCIAVLHEVHNTFGERHCYVLPVESPTQGESEWIHQQTDKALFVSPFAHMGMHYDFRLNVPGERQIVVIRASDDQGVVITASYTARQKRLTATRLGGYFIIYPMLTAKVFLGIHWEALKLWCKGVPWFKHQPKKTPETPAEPH